ncbi:MAG: stage V sporulation protein AD [Defluviitaleaceae bacterium]|nr:stage V sporulation protein AD [Defluviitaleaceae bacterium]
MKKIMGKQTVRFANPPTVLAAASIVGPKEGEGPLSEYFDQIAPDITFGTDSWEKAESQLVSDTIQLAVQKAKLRMDDIGFILAGDLLNQSSGSNYGIRACERPFFGLYGACSAIGEGMALGAMLLDGGFAQYVLANASSHYCGAEKTFRFPLELGTQRTPTASWTVTGDGAVVLAAQGNGPFVTAVTAGSIVDMGVTDASNMGAAMAPAAAAVITAHLRDRNLNADYFDAIVTGDLGQVGADLLMALLREEKIDIAKQYDDCGLLIYDREKQDVHAGGSGCGCAAVTFASYLLPQLQTKKINRLLFIPTGALHNVASIQQGETIPAIAHAIAIENRVPASDPPSSTKGAQS